MPRTASTSIKKYLSETAPATFLGKTDEKEYKTQMLSDMLLSDVCLLNDEAFFDKYPPGSLLRELESMDLPDGYAVFGDEALALSSMIYLGQQVARFPEILKRISAVLDGKVTFFMLFRGHRSFVRSLHTKLVSMGHFIPMDAFVELARNSNTTLNDIMYYKDRLAELGDYAHVSMPFEAFLENPVGALHEHVLSTPVPDGATLPYENMGEDLDSLSYRVFDYFEKARQANADIPTTRVAATLYIARMESQAISKKTFFAIDDEADAWLDEMEATHYRGMETNIRN